MEDISLEEKFLKIISKAEKNGFEFRTGFGIFNLKYIMLGRFCVEFEFGDEVSAPFEFHINEVFFNHNFAKAFFGDQDVCGHCGHNIRASDWKANSCSSCKSVLTEINTPEVWQYELSKLVLEKDLIEALYGRI